MKEEFIRSASGDETVTVDQEAVIMNLIRENNHRQDEIERLQASIKPFQVEIERLLAEIGRLHAEIARLRAVQDKRTQ